MMNRKIKNKKNQLKKEKILSNNRIKINKV